MVALLLLSLGTGAVPPFLEQHAGHRSGRIRIGYVADAGRDWPEAPFVAAERQRVADLGHELVDIRLTGSTAASVETALDDVDVLYVAGGSTFSLLDALRGSGADAVIAARVRAGLPYIGSSAGSIVTGPSVEPASLMDDPADAPGLQNHIGLGLVDVVVLPHADGVLPPYPPELIERTLEVYGHEHPLCPIRDDQALLVEDDGRRIVVSP